MKEKFQQQRPVLYQRMLKIIDLSEPFFPERLIDLVKAVNTRKMFSQNNLRVYPCDQDIFIMRSVEDDDLPFFGQLLIVSPQEIVFQLQCRRMLKTMHQYTLRTNAGHNMTYRTIFPGGIHSLKNDQQRLPVLGIQLILQIIDFPDVFL